MITYRKVPTIPEQIDDYADKYHTTSIESEKRLITVRVEYLISQCHKMYQERYLRHWHGRIDE